MHLWKTTPLEHNFNFGWLSQRFHCIPLIQTDIKLYFKLLALQVKSLIPIIHSEEIGLVPGSDKFIVQSLLLGPEDPILPVFYRCRESLISGELGAPEVYFNELAMKCSGTF